MMAHAAMLRSEASSRGASEARYLLKAKRLGEGVPATQWETLATLQGGTGNR